ncbi:fimbrillin family protein [Elizabethkingia meningoseptica]|nr:fimbrillin family protein [Elizabethkingia meningoseptica]
MKTDIKVIVIFSVLLLSSCRSTDQENTLSENGITAVKINLLGTEYTNTNIPVPVASSDKKGSLTNEKVQRQSTLITPSKVLIGELIPVPSAVEPLASVSKAINSTRSISGDKLRSGLKFRVIAYNKDGSYFTHEDYTIGRHATPLMLNGGEDYDIIIYSFSTDKLPDITKSEMLNIDNAAVYYDDGNEDFMYQRISYTPNGSNTNNTLDFTLRHRLSQITVVLKSSFGDISAIQKTYLEPHYHGGEILLSNARIKSEYAGAKKPSFSGPFPGSEQVSNPVLINSNDMSTFTADVTMLGYTKTVRLSGFKIASSTKSNLIVNLKTCSAYIAPGVLKEFMCHNLGADTSADPFTPSAAVHGAKYQWGAAAEEYGRYISQSTDQSNPGFRPDGYITTTDKADDSWLDTKKTSNDPCPSGFRVPTILDWEGVRDNNPNKERVGTWENGVNNYGAAIYYGTAKSPRTLMIPIAGYRGGLDGVLMYRGVRGAYWTSSNYNYGYPDTIGPDPLGKATFFLNEFNVEGRNLEDYMTTGASIRCIAE